VRILLGRLHFRLDAVRVSKATGYFVLTLLHRGTQK
jgi:hypothetical protein